MSQETPSELDTYAGRFTRKQYLDCLLIDAIEGGITGQWAQFQQIDRDDELNITKVVLIDFIDPVGDKPKKWTVTLDTMELGIQRLWKSELDAGHGTSRFPELFKSTSTNADDGDYDAVDADMILQFGLFGEAIYG